MARFSKMMIAIVNGIARSKLSLIGAVVTAILFPVLLFSIILDAQGIVENPYFGFLNYVILGPIFTAGLILIFVGLFFSKGQEDIGLFTYEYLKEQLTMPGRLTRVRKLIYLTISLTFVTIFTVGVISYAGFQYSESVNFCSMLCHRVMEPEYTTYVNSPHSRIPCVDCHIGTDAKWYKKTKIRGISQIFNVAFDTYSRPIKSPITNLRPNRKVCETCHRPEKFHGDKLIVIDKFLPDERNTHIQTVLLMRIGSAGYEREAHGIHWHVSENNKVTYKYSDREREKITQVWFVNSYGSKMTYTDENATDTVLAASRSREMDCIDCHNRPTHIFLSAEEAIDRKILNDAIPWQLPFIKRQAVEAVTRSYESEKEANKEIADSLWDWYKENYPDIFQQKPLLLKKAIIGVQQAYNENVFPGMNIKWCTYKNFIGHTEGSGCFRCHNDSLKTPSGQTISSDCTKCHIILAENVPAKDLLHILKQFGKEN